jgi:hypothetical protein
MLRDLATVVLDLHEGLQQVSKYNGVRLTQAEMTLPVDSALSLRDGGCTLLADVTRNHADAAWWSEPSRLTLAWAEYPTENLP